MITKKTCPICGKPEVAASKPFCSSRCANIDLGRWLGGHYVIPGPANEGDESEKPTPANDESGD